MTVHTPWDLAIVGGGLAGGLIALAAKRARPDRHILLVEAGERLGGNHIWSFFDSDVAPANRPLAEPLVSMRWPAHDVAFPDFTRTLANGYRSIRSDRFDEVVRSALPPESVRVAAAVARVTPTEIGLVGGERLAARGVIDARGAGDLSLLDLAWQKFVGRELRFTAPHGVARPTIMDAAVEQIDGYRFVYLLPFADDRLFIEDTYYSDTPDIDAGAIAERIEGYAKVRGWRAAAVEHEESAALPIVLGGDFEAYWDSGGPGVAKAGVRGGLFHPTTSYSLPDAVRTAAYVASLDDWSGAALHAALHDRAASLWAARGFYRLLDRMLFKAARPWERRRVFERFYRLDAGLIDRFYAGGSTLRDKARILVGRPPVSMGRAMKAAWS